MTNGRSASILMFLACVSTLPVLVHAQERPQTVAPSTGVLEPAADRWQIGTASSYLSGRYGADTRTTIFYTPTTARRLFADGDLTLVFPFTCISGDGGVTVVGGTPVRTDRTPAPDQPAREDGTERGRRNGAGAEVAAAPATPALRACGMGDVIVRGRYYVLDERGWLPTIALRAHVKAPTASAARGLGTGRPDEGIGIEVSRYLNRTVVAMADAGYTVIGKPEGVAYQNSWWYDAGVAQDFAGGIVNVSVFFEEYRSILPGFPAARDILASIMLRGSTGWRLQASAQFGLSDGAPDRGLTLGASRKF